MSELTAPDEEYPRTAAWKRNYGEFFINKLERYGLWDGSIEGVIISLESTCPNCFEQDRPCYCIRDD